MTEWRTVNLPKKFKEEIQDYAEENGYGSAKEFLIHVARKEMENQNTEEIVKKILREKDLIE